MWQVISEYLTKFGKFIINHLDIIFGLLLVVVCFGWFKSCTNYDNELEQKDGYIIDYQSQVASKDKDIKQLKMTMNDVSKSRDTLICQLDSVKDALGIKDKNTKELVYIKTRIHDTIPLVMKDTIFKDNSVHIDTTIIVNKWTSVGIKADFPNTLSITPDIASEKYIVTSTKREYVNKRSKIFFVRWFQKKRDVTVVDIVESNDLIKCDQSRFISVEQE